MVPLKILNTFGFGVFYQILETLKTLLVSLEFYHVK